MAESLAQRELRAVGQLQQIVQEVYALAPALPRGAPQAPAATEVLAGLGYVVALLNGPDLDRALPEGLSRSTLDSLVLVVRDWLARQASAQNQNSESVAGFFQRAGEHVQRLRTLPGPVVPEQDGKGD